jgi:small subunit ribosomal protein S20
MPIIQSAKKKLRQDRQRTQRNRQYEKNYKKAVKAVKKTAKTQAKGGISQLIKNAFRAIDKAVKKRVIHKNKGARLKSRISKIAKKS